MTKWEYKTMIVLVKDAEKFGDNLQRQYGQYGWELISMIKSDNAPSELSVLLVFKRQAA